jgi:hypothetical protein
MYLRLITCLIMFPLATSSVALSDDKGTTSGVDFFESRIRPILVEHCLECHSGDSKILRGGLRLDSRQESLKGGDSGPVLVPGKPEDSLLISAMKYDGLEMPPKGKLPDSVIADFETWIRDGASDPRTESRPARLRPVDWDAAKNHWAFQPLADPQPPHVDGYETQENPIDKFVLQRLVAEGFSPTPKADKRTLIRRATYDLIGLPPTVEEVRSFLADDSENSFEKVVDRLLASPQYGERWGRHWLDLVRYANTNGADENHGLPNAWRYRDWVVRMLNRDLPLNDFIVHQLAGDLLPAPSDESSAGDLLTATGMLVIGPKMLAEQDKEKMIIDIVDEQIDTVSRTMLGLTVGCARCHDHKFDPVSTRDYYALAGIFYSTQSMADRAFVSKWMERPLPSTDIETRRKAHQPLIDQARAEFERLKSELKDENAEPVRKQKEALEKLEKEMPQFEMVMSVLDAEPRNLPVHIRGNHLAPGPEPVPRAMPSILTEVHAASAIETPRSGRLELANWLVAPDHPLTTRVLMNRVWMWHFGKPLMRSPSNFGLQSEPPSHPELLDWLARELIRKNWSLKEMHKLILLSDTWQMSSQASGTDEERDPDNRLVRRQNRRRLEAEPVRDSILFAGGELDLTQGNIAPNTEAKRRAIYLPIDRSALYEMFSTFDYVETANHIEQRPATTVPQQALFIMNSSLVYQQSANMAAIFLKEASSESPEGQRRMIEMAFERLYSRLPTDAEVTRSEQFLSDADQQLSRIADPVARKHQAFAGLCRSLMAGNEFLFVD